MSGPDFLTVFRAENSARLAAWEDDSGNKTDGIFHAAELGGEVGEVLNVVKKLHREAMGWRGSRASVADLSDEIGDVMVCLDKLAAHYGIDLAEATRSKFNATSEKNGFPHRLINQGAMCCHCGAQYPTRHALCSPPYDVQPHLFNGQHPAEVHARAQVSA